MSGACRDRGGGADATHAHRAATANLAAIAKSEAVSLGTQTLKQGLPAATKAVANKADGWIFPTQTAARNQAAKDAQNARLLRTTGY